MNLAKMIGLVSALALMVAVTAYSEAHAASTTTTGDASTTQSPILWGMQKDMQNLGNQVKADWQQAKDNTKAAATQNNGVQTNDASVTAPVTAPAATPAAAPVAVPAADSYQARVISGSAHDANIMYNARTTATGMINQPVVDANGKKIATLKDIILDSTGQAVLAVIKDNGFMGVGDKLVALDYALVVQQNLNGDILMPISKDAFKKVKTFSYDTHEASKDVEIIPNNGYSTAQLLKGRLLDPRSASLGNIENVIFRRGQAAQVIVSFDQKLGLGGDKAALDFDDLTLARQKDGTLDFRMSDQQSAQFEAYKAIRTN